jgi:hypothetical protein
MTAGIIRLIIEKHYDYPGYTKSSDSLRIVDISKEEGWIADKIQEDMEQRGWLVHRECL